MTELKTHTGGCACGAVAYEVDTDLEGLMECNCSHCYPKGFVLAFVTFSDPTGEFECLFPPEQLRKCRETLEVGASVMVRVRAKSSDGEVRFFGDDASRLDALIDDGQMGLRIHVSSKAADPAALKARLDRARADGKGGEVSLVASLDGRREVELKLPGRYRLDGALRGALKSAPGVVLLEDA